jgi:sirohydrochlorin cobaltochelatase
MTDTKDAKRAILLVAFGTTVREAEAAYRNVERLARGRFPDAEIRWAYTSRTVMRKLAAEGRLVDTPTIALRKLAGDGFRTVVVQSVHLIPGEEFDTLQAELAEGVAAAGVPLSLAVGRPLLGRPEDARAVAAALQTCLPGRAPGEPVLWMGHGTARHPADKAYAVLLEALSALDPAMRLATVEGKPTFDDALPGLKALNSRRVWVAPFMAVAGDHARNDMAGDDPESWKSRLTAEGFEPVVVLRGIAECDGIVALWLDHLAEALERLERP